MKVLLFLLVFFSGVTHAVWTEGLGDLTCGQEGQKRCPFFTQEFWLQGSGSCDRGLRSKRAVCTKKRRDTLKNHEHKWISETLIFQRMIQADLPLNQVSYIRAHNSFNNKADQYLFENQIYSVTDLLELGVRNIELDLHFFNKQMRLCHGTNKHLICSPWDRAYFNAIEEINLWLRKEENKDEVIILDLEKYEDRQYHLTKLPLEHHLDDLLLRRSDIGYIYGWPSINQIKATGKRVILIGGPSPWSFGSFSRVFKNPKDFDGKLCKLGGYQIDPTHRNGSSSTRYVIHEDSTVYTTLWPGIDMNTGELTLEMLKQAVECNITGLSADRVDVAKAEATVWTWAKDEPLNWDKKDRCAIINPLGGWESVYCGKEYQFACQNKDKSGIWNITYRRGTFNEGEAACNREFNNHKFSHPKNGWENARLYKNHGKKVWINFRN